MRRLVLTGAAVLALLGAAPALASRGRPVALVTAETANEVLAVSLGPHGGKVLKRVHLADPLMIAAPLHGPAVVVSPRGTVTLLGWHSLRPIKVFRGFHDPQVAAVAPGGRFAYVGDEGSGRLVVIDLRRRRVVGRVFVGLQAHHMSFSPDGKRLWVALGETATTVVRLNTSDLRRPRVVGRIHPANGAHDVGFTPDGSLVWITAPSVAQVGVYAENGSLLEGATAGRGPQHVAFSGSNALLSSGYGSSLESIAWRRPYHRLRTVAVPYGSFNLAAHGGFVVTSSLFTGQVTELRVRDLHRLWTAKVAPATRYVAISVWPRAARRTAARTLNLPRGRVVRRFTLRQPDGDLRTWRLVAPAGIRAFLVARGPAALVRPRITTSHPGCRRDGPRTSCGMVFENCGAGAGSLWHVRLVKRGGPAARIRVVLGVYRTPG